MKYSFRNRLDLDQYAGHIIRCSAFLRDIQQALTGALLIDTVHYFKKDLLLIDHIGKAICTQKQALPTFQTTVKNIAFYRRLRADSAGDQVLSGIGPGLLLRQFSSVDHHLHQ